MSTSLRESPAYGSCLRITKEETYSCPFYSEVGPPQHLKTSNLDPALITLDPQTSPDTMLPTSLAIFGTPAHRVRTTDTSVTTIDPGNCPNNLRHTLSWIEDLRTYLDNDPAQYSEANKALITLNRMTPKSLLRFTEKGYDQIIHQPSSPKLFDTMVRDFKLAVTRCHSRTSSSKNFLSMNPQDRARFLRQHPAIASQTLPEVTQPSPFSALTIPTFRKWNPVERAKYLCQNRFVSKTEKIPQSTPHATPRHPPSLSPIPNRPPLSQVLSHSVAPVITGIPTERTLKISVCLHSDQEDYDTTAIIDSRATGSFIDTQLAQ